MTGSSGHHGEKTDRELVEACLSNNSGAWEVLIERYQRLIYSIPIRLGMTSQEAGDIFQCVCLILVRKLSTLRKQDSLYSWLITTTTRECWRVGARSRREAGPERWEPDNTADDCRTPENMAYERRIAEERNEVVRRALSQLPDRCRDLITMLYYLNEEPTYEDVAKRLNMPVSSIGPTRGRCLEKLKKILGDAL